MKTMYVLVWLLSNGTFQGEPWKPFNTLDECSNYQEESIHPVSKEKFAFFEGCIDIESKYNFTAIGVNLRSGLNDIEPKQ